MNLQEFVKLLRTRWLIVCATGLIVFLISVLYSLLQTPLYQASTRLFVSTTSGTTANDLYQGSRYSQERVFSYTQLVMGETLAKRTIDRLQLSMSPAELQTHVTATSKPGSVLINVSVLDKSPVRARDIADALSTEFVSLASELETPSEGGRPEARVVVEQKASIPNKPVVPNTRLNLALGAVLGVILGIAGALLRDRLDNTVKSQESLEETARTSVVGYIPFDAGVENKPAILFDADRSAVAESFRKLRTNLQFLAVDHPPQMIVVTSSSPSEGKSTTAINVALALAEADHRVVLVDADLRRPRLAKYLALVQSVGLSTVLRGGTALDEAIQETKFPNLKVLASGAIPPNPSEILGSLAAQNLLAELRLQFDYVIIDSPPLLAVTDAAILAARSDGALIVVRAGKTKRDQLAHAAKMLSDVGAVLLGSVLTMMPTRGSASYSYSYYYGGNYGDKDATPLSVEPATEA